MEVGTEEMRRAVETVETDGHDRGERDDRAKQRSVIE
jgi:hypothetical protein